MTNIIADMVLDLINGGENWKRELSIMTKEEKEKALEEMISMYQNVPEDRRDYIRKISEINHSEAMLEKEREESKRMVEERERELKEAREMFMDAFDSQENLCYESIEDTKLTAEEIVELEELASKCVITNNMKEIINSTKHLLPSDQYPELRKAEPITWETVPESFKQIAQEIKEREEENIMNEQLSLFAEEDINFDKVSQELKDIYEEEKEDGENFIKGIKCELRRRQEQGKDISIHNCRLL